MPTVCRGLYDRDRLDKTCSDFAGTDCINQKFFKGEVKVYSSPTLIQREPEPKACKPAHFQKGKLRGRARDSQNLWTERAPTQSYRLWPEVVNTGPLNNHKTAGICVALADYRVSPLHRQRGVDVVWAIVGDLAKPTSPPVWDCDESHLKKCFAATNRLGRMDAGAGDRKANQVDGETSPPLLLPGR